MSDTNQHSVQDDFEIVRLCRSAGLPTLFLISQASVSRTHARWFGGGTGSSRPLFSRALARGRHTRPALMGNARHERRNTSSLALRIRLSGGSTSGMRTAITQPSRVQLPASKSSRRRCALNWLGPKHGERPRKAECLPRRNLVVHQRSPMLDVCCGNCGGNLLMATCNHFRGTGHEWVLVSVCMICRVVHWTAEGCLDCDPATNSTSTPHDATHVEPDPASEPKPTCPECGRDLHGYRGPLCRYCDPEADCE